MLTLFLVLGIAFIISALLYEASAYKVKVDIEKFAGKALQEPDKVQVQERTIPDLAQRMRLQVAKPVYTEPPKAEYEGMLLPYPDMK